MKKIALMILCMVLLVLGFNNLDAGPIKLTVFGKGGIVQKPDGTIYVCPNTSQDVCTDVTIEQGIEPGGNFQGISGVMYYNGQQYQIEIVKVEILFVEGDHYKGQGLVVKGNIRDNF